MAPKTSSASRQQIQPRASSSKPGASKGKGKGGKASTPRKTPRKSGGDSKDASSPTSEAAVDDDEACDVPTLQRMLDEYLAPNHARILELQKLVSACTERLLQLGVDLASVTPSDGSPAPANAAPTKPTPKQKHTSVALWREVAGQHLSTMASSLEGSLFLAESGDDQKLKECASPSST